MHDLPSKAAETPDNTKEPIFVDLCDQIGISFSPERLAYDLHDEGTLKRFLEFLTEYPVRLANWPVPWDTWTGRPEVRWLTDDIKHFRRLQAQERKK